MENVILSDEKIDIIRNKVREEADPYSITNESIDYNDLLDKELIKVQARHLLRILKEPCTEHGRQGVDYEYDRSMLYFKDGYLYHCHRLNCPDCMKQIEKEINQ